MPTSLIPNKTKKRSSGDFLKIAKDSLREFASSLVLLGIVLVIYVAAAFWGSLLSTELEEVKSEKRAIVNSVNAQGDVMEFREFAIFVHQLQELLDNQNKPSELFDSFDDSIHERVVVRGFYFNMEDALIEIEGTASSFGVLAQQVLIWSSSSQFVENVELGSFGMNNEGNINFEAMLNVSKNHF